MIWRKIKRSLKKCLNYLHKSKFVCLFFFEKLFSLICYKHVAYSETFYFTNSMTYDPLESAATGYALRNMPLTSPDARRAVEQCQEAQQIQCDPYRKYRTADGTCNNLYNPHWGKAAGCFSRLLPPDYADGLQAPRVSVTGGPLPNPRILSAVLHRDLNYPATYTHFTMQYGQFFAHDIAFTPSSRTSKFV